MTRPSNKTSRLEDTVVAPKVVSELRIAIVGTGALGNDLYRLLGLISVGDILLIDPDRVEESNLTGSVLYHRNDIGKSKVQVLLERGNVLFPNTKISAKPVEIADLGWGRLQDRHLIFGCVDRDSARLELARIATRLHLPVCDGGLGGAGATAGRASYFPGRAGPCFGCRLSAATRRHLLREWQSQPYPCSPALAEPVRPNTPVITSITAGLMLDHALRSRAGSVEFRLNPPSLETITITQSDSCPFHDHPPAPLLSIEGSFAKNLAAGQQISWEWPICTQARCLRCKCVFNPFIRTSRLRAKALCPSCGSHQIDVTESIRSIASDSPWAERTPTEIGLPPDHRYTIWDKIPT